MNSDSSPAVVASGARRHPATFKLLFIAGMILLLHLPLLFINKLRQERMEYRGVTQEMLEQRASEQEGAADAAVEPLAAQGYRMVERALKHSVLVLALVYVFYAEGGLVCGGGEGGCGVTGLRAVCIVKAKRRARRARPTGATAPLRSGVFTAVSAGRGRREVSGRWRCSLSE